MLSIVYAPSFVRLYSKLPASLQIEIKDKIKIFQDKKNHKSLKVHKLKGFSGVFSFSVNYKNRIIFEYGKKNTAYLLLVGSHDEVY